MGALEHLEKAVSELAQEVSELKEQFSSPVQERMLDAKALVAMGIPRAAAYNLFNRADFPTINIGRRKFVRSSRLFEYLEQKGELVDDGRAV